jgi:quinol monooxygenase YgiN
VQNNNTVRVLARITARSEKIDELRSILLQLVEETRKENGCVSYQRFQNKADPSDFTVVEDWANDLAIDSHMRSAHVQNAFTKAVPLLATAPEIKRYRVIG